MLKIPSISGEGTSPLPTSCMPDMSQSRGSPSGQRKQDWFLPIINSCKKTHGVGTICGFYCWSSLNFTSLGELVSCWVMALHIPAPYISASRLHEAKRCVMWVCLSSISKELLRAVVEWNKKWKSSNLHDFLQNIKNMFLITASRQAVREHSPYQTSEKST